MVDNNTDIQAANKPVGVANIGVIGLAAMGSNLSRNLAHHGNTVAVYNRTYARTETLLNEHGSEGKFVPSATMKDFVASLAKPRTAIILVKAGAPTDDTIHQLADLMEPGDIIIDGGNTYFKDTIAREKEIRARGFHYVGMGVSGGEEGALNGPSLMPGGTDKAWETLGPILRSIAAVAEGEPCVTHIGENGAGHFVKMVHNGIEYSDMQLIAESFDLLRRGLGIDIDEIADIFAEWNKGELDSYLIEITSEVLRQLDAKTGKHLVDMMVDEAGMKGTGQWTVQTALDLKTPVTGIGEAVFARAISGRFEQRDEAQKDVLPGPDQDSSSLRDASLEEKKSFIEDIRHALYASKIIAYAQGFDEIADGEKEYDWNIDCGAVARIWRGGCIIRAKFLNKISDAYDNGEVTSSLIFNPYFKDALAEAQDSWRRVVSFAALNGIPTPVFSSSLAYYDGLRSKRLPAALVRGQRDFFGAHTYNRIDEPGVFHTLWAEPGRKEIKES